MVHPRTSRHGPEAFTELAGARIEGDIRLSEMVFTETRESGMRILNRFPLTAFPPVRMVAGLLRRDGRVLLCHRRPDRTHYPDVWDLSGGHIEEGESTIDAIARELKEELGIIPQLAEDPPWLKLTANDIQLHVYLIDRWRGEPRNVAVDEHDEIRWISAGDLAHLDLAHPSFHHSALRRMPPFDSPYESVDAQAGHPGISTRGGNPETSDAIFDAGQFGQPPLHVAVDDGELPRRVVVPGTRTPATQQAG